MRNPIMKHSGKLPTNLTENKSEVKPLSSSNMAMAGPMPSRVISRVKVTHYENTNIYNQTTVAVIQERKAKQAKKDTYIARMKWLAKLALAESERELTTVTIELANLDEAANPDRPWHGHRREWLQARKSALQARVRRG